MEHFLIIFCAILIVFGMSRLVTFLAMKSKILPNRTLANNRKKWKIHHFVYGNILLVVTGFLSIVYGFDGYIITVLYGVGLGLVLDEFPHWMGDVKELQRNVLIIPGGLVAVCVALIMLLILIVVSLLT